MRPAELFRCVSPIWYSLLVQKLGNDVVVTGRVRAAFSATCDRCCGLYDWEFDGSAFCHFQENVDESVELAEPLREYVLIGLPAKWLCADGCRGLCGLCGRNLNEGGCDCRDEPDTGPSAWDSLDSLKL